LLLPLLLLAFLNILINNSITAMFKEINQYILIGSSSSLPTSIHCPLFTKPAVIHIITILFMHVLCQFHGCICNVSNGRLSILELTGEIVVTLTCLFATVLRVEECAERHLDNLVQSFQLIILLVVMTINNNNNNNKSSSSNNKGLRNGLRRDC